MAFGDFFKNFSKSFEGKSGKEIFASVLDAVASPFDQKSQVVATSNLFLGFFRKLFELFSGGASKEFEESVAQIAQADAVKTVNAEIESQLGDKKTLYKYTNEASEKEVTDLMTKAREEAKKNLAKYVNENDREFSGQDRIALMADVSAAINLDNFTLDGKITPVGKVEDYSAVLASNNVTSGYLRTDGTYANKFVTVLPSTIPKLKQNSELVQENTR